MTKFWAHIFIPTEICPVFTGELSQEEFKQYLKTFGIDSGEKFVFQDCGWNLSSVNSWCIQCPKGWAIMLKEVNY